MSYEEILQWFEKHPEARPEDLVEDVAVFMRGARSGEIATPADFLAHFYILHLKKKGLPLPRTAVDYGVEFVEKACDFFDYVSSRCVYVRMKKQGLLTYHDPNVPLLESDIKKELKIEATEKGKKVFGDFQKKLEEVYKQASEEQKKQEKSVATEK